MYNVVFRKRIHQAESSLSQLFSLFILRYFWFYFFSSYVGKVAEAYNLVEEEYTGTHIYKHIYKMMF